MAMPRGKGQSSGICCSADGTVHPSYYRAHERGVKMVGASAHYVTGDLDEGPIIAQDVSVVDHADSVEDLIAQGQDTESRVLARAVKAHIEHRVILNGNRTVVFK